MIAVDCSLLAADTLWLAAVVLVQVTLVTSVALALARLAHADPARRHGILLAAILFVLVCPLEAWMVRATRLCVLAVPSVVASIEPTVDEVTAGVGPVVAETPPSVAYASKAEIASGSPVVAPATVRSAPQSPQVDRSSAPAATGGSRMEEQSNPARSHVGARRDLLGTAAVVAVVSWALGSLVLAVRLGHGAWRLARLRRRAATPPEGVLDELLEAISRELGMKRMPRIGICPGLAGPAAVGIFHPAILLPPAVLELFSRSQLRAVLMHECAHVARRDCRIGLLQRIVALIFWFHPLVHRVNRELSHAREEICDNFVLRHGERVAYGRLLLAWSGRFDLGIQAGTIGMFRGPGTLERRIAGLLDPRRSLNTTGSRWLVSGLTAMFLAVALPLAAVRAASTLAQSDTTSPASQTRDDDRSTSPILAELARLGATWQLDSSGHPRSICLDDTKATDDDLATLAQLHSLTDLSLRNTAITDRGLRRLAGLVQLESLNLARTRITDAGLPHLRGLPRLTSLGVADTAVTAEGLRAIDGHQERPDAVSQPSGGLGGSGGASDGSLGGGLF